MNPYAKFLDGRNPLDLLASNAKRLSELLTALGPEAADRPISDGKWSPRQILCHLADCEIVFAFRLRQTLAEPHHVIQPFDQDAWAANYNASVTAAGALAVFTTVRNWNLALIRGAGPEAMAKPVSHPERGAMTFETIVETMAGHDINHIQQIEAVSSLRAAG